MIMHKNKSIKINKELCLSILLLLIIAFVNQSCQKEEQIQEEEEIVINEEDCEYEFSEELDNIYGVWEPAIVIDYETGDSTFYDIGEGHQGHMFNGNWYADSFELRDNGEFKIFYTTFGKPCKDEVSGMWTYEDMIMNFYLNGDTVNISVLLIEEDKLIIEDIMTTKESQVIMSRIN